MYVWGGFKIVVRKRTMKWRQSNCSGETIRNMLSENVVYFEMNNKEQTIANEDNSVEEQ